MASSLTQRIEDKILRKAVIKAERLWNRGVPFSTAIIRASRSYKAVDINKIVDHMLELAQEKIDETDNKKSK